MNHPVLHPLSPALPVPKMTQCWLIRHPNPKRLMPNESWLRDEGYGFVLMMVLIQLMLVVPSNVSLIDRSFNHLELIQPPTRASLDFKQLERLVLLKLNLPSLREFPFAKLDL
jgi:hypothetical protein